MLYPVLLTVFSSAAYHLLLKQTSAKASPVLVLFWSYALAASVCLVVLLYKGEELKVFSVFKEKGWIPVILAIALVGIEVGYVWSYKTGGKVGQVTLITQMVSLVLMMGIGYFMTREPLTLQKLFGIASALFGVHLLR